MVGQGERAIFGTRRAVFGGTLELVVMGRNGELMYFVGWMNEGFDEFALSLEGKDRPLIRIFLNKVNGIVEAYGDNAEMIDLGTKIAISKAYKTMQKENV